MEEACPIVCCCVYIPITRRKASMPEMSALVERSIPVKHVLLVRDVSIDLQEQSVAVRGFSIGPQEEEHQ